MIPQYTLRRVWLSKEEEDGYYYGFANEGLWPLCHIAHTRPTFRAADWEHYQSVNAKFADAVARRDGRHEHPVVVVQDYHFALLPRMIKQRRPDARVGIFWHIPWPNPEAFGICPWQRELLERPAGRRPDRLPRAVLTAIIFWRPSTALRIPRRVGALCRQPRRTRHAGPAIPYQRGVSRCRRRRCRASTLDQAECFANWASRPLYVGVGVDRVDYTKGILERFRGVERFLEKYPQYQGKFTFIQIGAPSRTNIKRYDDFMHEVVAEAERVNRTLQTARWRPIIFRNFHHTRRGRALLSRCRLSASSPRCTTA